jgi:hypothetical protein
MMFLSARRAEASDRPGKQPAYGFLGVSLQG